mgnify:CR=1 FL=1
MTTRREFLGSAASAGAALPPASLSASVTRRKEKLATPLPSDGAMPQIIGTRSVVGSASESGTRSASR